MPAIVGAGDVLLSDELKHASIIDGVRLSYGKALKFRHNDPDDLEKKLKLVPEGKGKLIVVDGVFSMEGDITPLPEIVKHKNTYGAGLFVDEAHSLGVFGEHGRGITEHFGLEEDVDLIMGTFSKSFATVGGFITTDDLDAMDLPLIHVSEPTSPAALPHADFCLKKHISPLNITPNNQTNT